ncbi:hypothetical protein [Streptomyces cyaneofuscatus]|uniref:hypothetical protein n=1 Tax=Streptomyces cyaneofuscatus TaxID=66883 RepID=UPI0037B94B71
MQRRHGSDPSRLTVQHTLYPAAYVLRLEGNADPTTSDALATTFSLAANWSLPLIVDLSALDFGDEELLGHLIYAHQTSGLTVMGPISDPFQRRHGPRHPAHHPPHPDRRPQPLNEPPTPANIQRSASGSDLAFVKRQPKVGHHGIRADARQRSHRTPLINERHSNLSETNLPITKVQ